MSILFIVFLWAYAESFRIGVTRVDMRGTPFSTILSGKTVVQLTDLHMHALGYREEKTLAILEGIKPDMIFLTGDYIPWHGDVQVALSFLARLNPPLGAFGVMGDYDYSNSRASCLYCHKANTSLPTQAHGVHMLKNEQVQLTLDGKNLVIMGLDYNGKENNSHVNRLLHDKGQEPMIVLSHNPLRFDDMDKQQKILMVSGDTHGGQLYLPSFLWHALGYEKNARYNQGLFHEGQNTLFVSRGVGTSHVPFRLFCPPEIVVYQF